MKYDKSRIRMCGIMRLMKGRASMRGKREERAEVFIEAYGEHQKALLRRSFFKLNNKNLSEDLVQMTFLKMWEYLSKGGEIDSTKAFLFHVLNNLIVDEYRKKKEISLEVLSEKGFQIAIDDSEEILDMVDGKTAVLLLPLLEPKYRGVVEMRYIDDMPLKEIARATLQSKNTVSVQIRRGIDKLAILFRMGPGESVRG